MAFWLCSFTRSLSWDSITISKTACACRLGYHPTEWETIQFQISFGSISCAQSKWRQREKYMLFIFAPSVIAICIRYGNTLPHWKILWLVKKNKIRIHKLNTLFPDMVRKFASLDTVLSQVDLWLALWTQLWKLDVL